MDYLGQVAVRAAVLPARAAYLISEGSVAGFRRAIQEACTRWGGMTEPIVPVPAGGKVADWWLRVATLTGVDGVVNVDVVDQDAAAAMACDNGSLWEAVAAGDLTDEHLTDLRSAPGLTQPIRPRTDDQVARAQLRGDTLLDRTVVEFAEDTVRGGPWPCPAVVWVTEPDDLEDCLFFWNLRASSSSQDDGWDRRTAIPR